VCRTGDVTARPVPKEGRTRRTALQFSSPAILIVEESKEKILTTDALYTPCLCHHVPNLSEHCTNDKADKESISMMASLIDVLNTCDNFRPHLSPEHLVPFLLSQDTRPALGLLRPAVVVALRADNAWRAASGHPLAWEIPEPVHVPGNEGDSSPPYIAFAPALARGTPAARTLALAETLERWRAAANDNESSSEPASGSAFAGVIGGSRWRAEWYDVYASPGGALRTDGRDPRTVLEAPQGASGYVFSMERSACALFGVVTYGVHMTVYEQDGEGEGGQVRVWVPRRALTKPTCVFCSLLFVYCPLTHSRGRRHVKLPWHARQLRRGWHSWGDDCVRLDYQRGCGGGEPGSRTCAQACSRRWCRNVLLSD
jgi:hypothetical protein